MKKLLTFDEFVNEHYNVQEATDADGFNPTKTTDKDEVEDTIKELSGLVPGKEYELTIDGKGKKNMMFQGVTDSVYIFNSEDQEDAVRFSEEEMTKIVSAGAKKVSL
jgi:hypothetical protein